MEVRHFVRSVIFRRPVPSTRRFTLGNLAFPVAAARACHQSRTYRHQQPSGSNSRLHRFEHLFLNIYKVALVSVYLAVAIFSDISGLGGGMRSDECHSSLSSFFVIQLYVATIFMTTDIVSIIVRIDKRPNIQTNTESDGQWCCILAGCSQ